MSGCGAGCARLPLSGPRACSPITVRRRGSHLLLTLLQLPEAVYCTISSYLELSDLLCASLGSRLLREAFMPQVLRVALRRQQTSCKAGQAPLQTTALLSLLGRLDGLKELSVSEPATLQVVWEALQAGHGRAIEALHVSFDRDAAGVVRDTANTTTSARMLHAVECGALAGLRHLQLAAGSPSGARVEAHVSFAGTGGCCPPAIDLISLPTPSPTGAWLAELALALDGMDAAGGCCAVSGLRLRGMGSSPLGDNLGRVLRTQACRGLEVLEASPCLSVDDVRTIADYISTQGAESLLELRLDCDGSDFALDSLAEAFCEGAWHLRSLSLTRGALEDSTCDTLVAAIERGAWLELESLRLDGLEIDSDGLARVMKAVGKGHGCPALRRLEVVYDDDAGACSAVALAIQHGGLPALEELVLEACEATDGEVRELAKALMANTSTSSSLRTLRLIHGDYGLKGLRSLLDAFRAGACVGLRTLDISRSEVGDGGLQDLASALMDGVGRELREINMAGTWTSYAGLAAVSKALVAGACPKLTSLRVGTVGACDAVRGGFEPLSSVVEGRPTPCPAGFKCCGNTAS